MLQQILDFLKRIFKIEPKVTANEMSENGAFLASYEDITETNLVYIVSNKLANIVVSDATIEVANGGTDKEAGSLNPRADYLNTSLQQLIARLKVTTARTLGIGGIVLKPYVVNSKIYTDILAQNRYFVIEQEGEVVKKAGFIADEQKVKDVAYTRVETHELADDGTYTIEQKALKEGKEVPLSTVPEWANLIPVITIHDVEKPLYSFIKCPIDSKKQMNNIYGVPITYGNNKLIKDIVDLINEFQAEYVSKKAFIGADSLLFDDADNLPKSGLYKLFNAASSADNKAFWEVFSPDIRNSSYIDGINFKMGLLEKAIGVNKGVLTDLETVDATATAIKRSTLDTFNLVDSMRKNIETAINQLVYAFDVYCNALNLVPAGEYEIAYDWSYSLIEDSQETFTQLFQAMQSGVVKPEEMRMFLFDENEEEAIANLPESTSLLSDTSLPPRDLR